MEKKTETAACQRHRPMMENISKTDTGKTHFIIKLMNNEWKQTVAAIAELCQLQADQCICVQPCNTMQFDFLIMGSGVIEWERTKVRLSLERTSVDSYCVFVGGNDVEDADNVQCTWIVDANVYLTTRTHYNSHRHSRPFAWKSGI